MNTSTLSVYSLRVEDGTVVTDSGGLFDVIAYSKFKYGDGAVSDVYGKQLADVFIAAQRNMLQDGVEIAVTSASYRYVPKGATSIAFFFAKYLNEYLDLIGKPRAALIKISNDDSFTGDYASFSGEKREELMKKSALAVEGDVLGKKLIIIDDIRITGAGERRLVNFFADKGPSEIVLLYVAVADPAYAATNPEIESIINHSWMDSLEKLGSIMRSEHYMINARVCKYLLSYPDQITLEAFLNELPRGLVAELYDNVTNDNHATIPEYKESIALIKKVLDSRSS